MTEASYYIGIMSGTSADGVDLALVDFSEPKPILIAHHYQKYSAEFQQKITSLYAPDNNEIDRLGSLGVELAHCFAKEVKALLKQHQLSAQDIIAIGCHGQTIRHRPTKTTEIPHPFTLQIGCHQTLACLTDIRVIGDFRSKDIALGGQGAPLVPAFHQYLFSSREQDTAIVNLGGIANVTFLPKNPQQAVTGYDIGPANALLDLWCLTHTGKPYDQQGQWGASGQVQPALLTDLLSDHYFAQPAPKSTGREYFTLDWLRQYLKQHEISAVDVQATLIALTAKTIAVEINRLSPKCFVYLCGGGIENLHCYKQIKQELKHHHVETILSLDLNNNAFEAMAFAWLAFAYDKKIYGNLPTVTGASRKTVLGIEFSP